MASPRSVRIGVDLGGTKIEAIAIGPDGKEHSRRRVPTPTGDYMAILAAIADLVAVVEREIGTAPSPVGIGIPGETSPATGLIKNANSTCLIGKPFERDIAQALGRPVRLANDANCLAVSEAADGAGAGANVVFAAILGTGVGGGVAIQGKPLIGCNAIAGEWGHNPLPWPADAERPGPDCYCGKRGCIETFLSGPGFSRDHAEAAGLASPLPAQNIAEAAYRGDGTAEAALARYTARLARALATMINVLDPDVIVLGGGMSNIKALYEAVPAQWGAWVFSDRVDTSLVPAKHGDSSGVRGAAWLWPAMDN